MDIEFSEHQEVLRDTAREYFSAHCPLSRVRELEASELRYSPELWRGMAELDWAGLSFPEELDGAGGSLLDLFVLYLETGRALVPSPHLASSVLAGETLLAAGSDAQKKELLPRMARGEVVVPLALVEPSGEYGPAAVQLRATRDGAAFRLDGSKILVPYAHVAEQLLVVARCGGGAEELGLFLVEPGAPGVKTEPLDNIAGQPLFAVVFESAPAAAVGEPGRGWQQLGPVLDRGSVLQCAEIVGAGERVLEMAVQYAKDREQFGTPIGKFQAVQYLCSDIAIEIHLASLLARQAAWAIEAGQPSAGPVAMAAAHASRAAQHVVHCAQEVFAGHGFMLENDIQLFTRRAKHWEFNLGDARYHFERVAASLA